MLRFMLTANVCIQIRRQNVPAISTFSNVATMVVAEPKCVCIAVIVPNQRAHHKAHTWAQLGTLGHDAQSPDFCQLHR